MKKLTTSVAKYMFALPFGIFGIFHLTEAENMAGLVPSFIPGSGEFWVYVTGLCLIAACASILSGRYAGPACLSLAALMGVFILTIHIPGMSDPNAAQMATVGLLKDFALAGAALTHAGLVKKQAASIPITRNLKRAA